MSFSHSRNFLLEIRPVFNGLFCRNYTTDLKSVLAKKIVKHQQEVKNFRSVYGDSKIGDITVNMLYGGMRGMKALVWETSVLDPEEGIRFRGYSIPECQTMLPRAEGGDQPLPEGLFWLLCTGDIPTESQVKQVSRTWNEYSKLPDYISEMLYRFPSYVHPMSQFVAAIAALNSESVFTKAYASGIKKSLYWEYIYEDCMSLIGKLTTIAATIFRNCFRDQSALGEIDKNADWSANFAKMLGFHDPLFQECMRMYLTIHSDHEGGNVSAHASHLVGSALSDPFLSFSAAMCGLAGPLHGLANQEVLIWLRNVEQKLGHDASPEKLTSYVKNELQSGRVIPGYGHAVLRRTDPRYTCQREFALKHFPDFSLFKLTSTLYDVVPPVLKGTGKVQNPWPNVDAHSGVLLQYFKMTEMNFYTVLFGVSRALGCTSQMIWSRALGFPLERPKSMSTEGLMKMVGAHKRESTPHPLDDIQNQVKQAIKIIEK
ncbi:unnamed protein product [Cyprideis torosa]|uniref:Citrate synthase n=1 Tax=Cyprideis torosa TaxID=163714 RepID=A0A7R8ZQC7_9CRUS|nr:unnamed protein product [Cyprideis torosa]CAG0890370.1 unnamed protein product [Cyprideis torosa]